MHWIWQLAILTECRETKLQQVNELNELIERKASGEDFSEDSPLRIGVGIVFACTAAIARRSECY
jgi:hypothetical protein